MAGIIFDADLNITATVLDYNSRRCPVPPPTWLTTEYELTFTCAKAFVWLVRTWWLPWTAAAVYLASIPLGVRLMERRGKPFGLRTALFAWNAALAAFSIFATFKVSPVYYLVWTKGLKYTLLHDGYPGCNGHCFWAFLFLCSKFVELGDTAFLVLRRRPVSFLHAYHHATVLLFTCWICLKPPSGLLPQYMTINYTIHAFMYSYFACMARGVRVPKNVAVAITCAQISQMFYGVYVTYSMYVYTRDTGMPTDLKVALWIYASYAALFLNFFVRAYLLKPKSAAGPKAGSQQQKVQNGAENKKAKTS